MRGSRPGERRGGRQVGTPNKVTKKLKEMVLEALDRAGGIAYLTKQANANPTAFLSLVSKLLPRENKPEESSRLTLGELVEAAIEHGKQRDAQLLDATPLLMPPSKELVVSVGTGTSSG